MYQSDKNFESHCNYNNIFMNVIDVANSDENEVVYYKQVYYPTKIIGDPLIYKNINDLVEWYKTSDDYVYIDFNDATYEITTPISGAKSVFICKLNVSKIELTKEL